MKAEWKFSLFIFLVVFLLILSLIIFPWQRLREVKGREAHDGGHRHSMAAPMEKIEFGLILLTGLLGGAHCIGMCGGIVAAYSFKLGPQGKNERGGYGFLGHLLFNSGRVISYAIIGATMGIAGSLIIKNPWFHSFQGIIPLFLGLLMLFLALSLAGVLPRGLNIFPSSSGEGGEGGLGERLMGKVLAGGSLLSLLILGFMAGFLPCGLVYAVAVKAAATGSLGGGVLTMTVFGLGTWPALWVLGAATWKLSFVTAPQYRIWAYRLAAVSVAFLGVITLVRGILFWV